MIDGKSSSAAVGDVVIITSDEGSRGKWPLGEVEEVFAGRHGIDRAAKVKTGNGHVERPINHLCPLELTCEQRVGNEQIFDPEVPAFQPTCDTALASRARIQLLVETTDMDK